MNKQLVILFCIFAAFVSKTYAQEIIPDEVLVSYTADQIPLKSVLLELTEKTGVNIAFQDEILPVDSLVSINVRNKKLGLVIDELIDNTETKYKIIGNQLVIIKDKYSKANENITISGYLTDLNSGETLIAANAFLFDRSAGTISNEYGFYSLTIPKGIQRVYYTYLGYKMKIKEIRLTKDTTINIALDPEVLLNEVLILDKQQIDIEETPASIENVPIDRITSFVSLAGETDVLRIAQSAPGVNTGADGFGGMSVRGGSVDQNLILMDGIPIYNPNHALGIFSIFNSNVIKSSTLYKSGFPARYGSRLSSVMDIRIREGNKERFSGDVAFGLLTAKATLEGPIVKGKSSFLFSYRRSFLDLWLPQLQNFSRERSDLGFYFYDFNGKVNFKLGEKTSVYLSYYKGEDNFLNSSEFSNVQADGTDDFLNKNEYNWGNEMGVVRLSRQLGKKSFLKAAVYITNYNLQTFDLDSKKKFEDSTLVSNSYLAGIYQSKISDKGVNLHFDYLPNSKNTIRFGTSAILHNFNPGIFVTEDLNLDEGEDVTSSLLQKELNSKDINGTEFQIYIEDNIKPNQHNTINLGFHQSIISSGGRTFFLPQPRLAYLYHKKAFTFKSSISFVSQYLHLISNAGLGIPVDVWLPSTKTLVPQKGWLASTGIGLSSENGYEIGTEVYYKRLSNLLSFSEGEILDINEGDEWQERVPVGKGEAYGIETYLNKTTGNANFSLNYTWSKSLRQFDDLNNGVQYPYRFDRRHNLKFSYVHKINTNAEFTFNWTFATPNPITTPSGLIPIVDDEGNTEEILIYEEKNGNDVILENYHRLDLGFNFYSKYKWGRSKFSIGLFNMYNRTNFYYVDIIGKGESQECNENGETSLFCFRKYYLLPVLPSISWNLSF